MRHSINMEQDKKFTDLSYLEAAAMGSNEFITEMIDLYLDQTETILSEIDTAINNKDFNTAQKLMHKMKPTVQMVGLNNEHETLTRLEKSIDKGEIPDDLQESMNKVRHACTIAINELEELKGKYQ